MRKSDVHPDPDLYITYEGAASKSLEPLTFVREVLVQTLEGSTKMLVLADAVPSRGGGSGVDAKLSFQSSSAGLIDISRYGITPRFNQDLTQVKLMITNFVTSSLPEHTMNEFRETEANILVNRTGIDRCQ